MPKALEATPTGPPPQDPYTQLFLPLIVFPLFQLFLNTVAWPSHILCVAELLVPIFLNSSISSKRGHMKCLILTLEVESGQFPLKIIWFYPFVIESLYLCLLCLCAALLCYTGFQYYSLIRSISCSCSTCCFGLAFQHQNLQDFIKIIRALIEDIFLKVLPRGRSGPPTALGGVPLKPLPQVLWKAVSRRPGPGVPGGRVSPHVSILIGVSQIPPFG